MRASFDLSRWWRLAAPLCAAASLFAVYAESLRFPFVIDDLDAIVHNESLTGPLTAAWLPPDDTPVSGRPLVNLSFALNYRLSGQALEPFGFRLFNLALHALNAWLVFALLRTLLARPVVPEHVRNGSTLPAALIALLWACHPLQTEAVSYVTQRTELLSATFVLLSVLFALRHLERPRAPDARSSLLAAAVCCALGSGCKETLIAVPVLVAVLDLAFYSSSIVQAARAHRALYIALCVGLLPLYLQLLTQPRDRTAGFGLGISPWQTLALSGQAIAWYLRLCAWPAPLSISYNWSFQGGFARYWAGDLGIAALAVLTLWSLRSRPVWGAAGGWLFALLAPTTSVLPIISEPLAERRMYLPLLAVVSVCVLGLWAWLSRRPGLVAALCLLLTAAAALRSHARTEDYASDEKLFRAALAAAPDDPHAMYGLGSALEERGQLDAALALYERMAAEPYPYAGPASWGTRGLMAAAHIHEARGDLQRARDTVRRALEHDPESAVGKLQLAGRLAATGQSARAIAALEAMLSQPFLLDRAHAELARLYAQRGDGDRARLHFEAAQRLNPAVFAAKP